MQRIVFYFAVYFFIGVEDSLSGVFNIVYVVCEGLLRFVVKEDNSGGMCLAVLPPNSYCFIF